MASSSDSYGLEAAAQPLIRRRRQEEAEVCCGALRAEVTWARDEAHHMIWQYSCGCCMVDMESSLQRELWFVKYNPIYWFTMVVTMVCMLIGKWTHSIVGQGGPVRDDELDVEREARIQWIYTTDGPFVVSILFTAIEAIATKKPRVLSLLFDLLIDAAYVGGNVLFLDSMARKNIARIRVGIVANAAFAIALTVLLVTGIIHHAHERWSFYDRATWCVRSLTVVFFAFAVFIYAGLWNAHPFDKVPQALISPDIAAALGMIAAAAIVWALLVLVIVISPAFVWDAIAT